MYAWKKTKLSNLVLHMLDPSQCTPFHFNVINSFQVILTFMLIRLWHRNLFFSFILPFLHQLIFCKPILSFFFYFYRSKWSDALFNCSQYSFRFLTHSIKLHYFHSKYRHRITMTWSTILIEALHDVFVSKVARSQMLRIRIFTCFQQFFFFIASSFLFTRLARLACKICNARVERNYTQTLAYLNCNSNRITIYFSLFFFSKSTVALNKMKETKKIK